MVEAIVENLDAKRGLFAELEAIVADDCVAAVMACLLLHGAIWLDGRMEFNWLVAS